LIVEHVQRQDEREQEIRGDVDQLEERGDELEERAEELDDKIDATREEFQRKQQAEDVPGAQEPGGHGTGSEPPPEAEIAPGDDAA
jgi:chaperonin cofactor prefoldin